MPASGASAAGSSSAASASAGAPLSWYTKAWTRMPAAPRPASNEEFFVVIGLEDHLALLLQTAGEGDAILLGVQHVAGAHRTERLDVLPQHFGGAARHGLHHVVAEIGSGTLE